jgi:hypothetical protein
MKKSKKITNSAHFAPSIVNFNEGSMKGSWIMKSNYVNYLGTFMMCLYILCLSIGVHYVKYWFHQ